MRTIAVVIVLLGILNLRIPAQENTFRIQVLGYEWTTTHRTLTFSWPGYANTSCTGTSYVNGFISGSNLYANGMSSDSCSTTYTPPTNQNIDILKPVVYVLADSATSRMILTCTRNVRWSQCHALSPGAFLARIDHGHFEVQAVSSKNKFEWVKFEVVQQTPVNSATSNLQTLEVQQEQQIRKQQIQQQQNAQQQIQLQQPCPAGTERRLTSYGSDCEPSATTATTSRAQNSEQPSCPAGTERRPTSYGSDCEPTPIPSTTSPAKSIEQRVVAKSEGQPGPTYTDLTITSTPTGADVAIDGHFVGNTPSTFTIAPGDHDVSIGMEGYEPWNRTIYTSGGKVNLTPVLVKGKATLSTKPKRQSPQSPGAGSSKAEQK